MLCKSVGKNPAFLRKRGEVRQSRQASEQKAFRSSLAPRLGGRIAKQFLWCSFSSFERSVKNKSGIYVPATAFAARYPAAAETPQTNVPQAMSIASIEYCQSFMIAMLVAS